MATHINGSVTFNGNFAYTPAGADAVAVNGGTFGTCGVNTCHNNGQSSAAISPYTWNTQLGGGTNSCTECHNATSSTLASNSHGPHLTASTLFGVNVSSCGTCHAAATVGTHANGSVTFSGSFAYTPAGADAVAVNGGTFGTCGVNFCHNNGQSGATAAYTWSTAIPNCTECHGNTSSTLASNSHGPHLTTWTGLGAVCNDCHAAGSVATHINGSVTFNGNFAYTPAGADAVAVNGGTFGTCGVNQCHNNGQSSAAILGYTWNTVLGGGTNSCTECHDATSSTLASNSHGPHLTTNTGAGALCSDCHATASTATHANGSVTFNGSFTYTPAGAERWRSTAGRSGPAGSTSATTTGRVRRRSRRTPGARSSGAGPTAARSATAPTRRR